MKKNNIILLIIALMIGCALQSCKTDDEDYDKGGSSSDSLSGGGNGEAGLTITKEPLATNAATTGQTHIIFYAPSTWSTELSANGKGWLDISPRSGDKGENTITINISQNASYEERLGTITLRCGSESKVFNLVQKQRDAILLSSGLFEIDENENPLSVKISSNMEYEYDIKADWITVSTSKSLSEKTFSFVAKANDSFDKREGVIRFTSADKTKTEDVRVKQAGKKRSLSIQKTTFKVPQGGGEVIINMEANDDINGREPLNDWIFMDMDRTTSTKVVYVIQENRHTIERKEELHYVTKDQSISIPITITQEAMKPSLEIKTPTSYDVDWHEREIEFTVDCNTDYNISCPAWTRTDIRGKEGQNTHKLTINPNLNSDRQGSIVIENVDKTLKREIKIVQHAKVDKIELDGDIKTEFEYEGGETSFSVTSADIWSAEVSRDATSWIHMNPQAGPEGTSNVEVTIDNNPGNQDRSGSITFESGDKKETINFHQKMIDDDITVIIDGKTYKDGDRLEVKGEAHSLEVSIKCKIKIAKISLIDWITGPTKCDAGENILKYAISEHNGQGTRSSSFIIINEFNKSVSISVTQLPKE